MSYRDIESQLDRDADLNIQARRDLAAGRQPDLVWTERELQRLNRELAENREKLEAAKQKLTEHLLRPVNTLLATPEGANEVLEYTNDQLLAMMDGRPQVEKNLIAAVVDFYVGRMHLDEADGES